jgi:hypothetical protein
VSVLPLAAVQFGQLLKVVWVSLVAGLVVTVSFALVVRSSARSMEARRAGDGGAAARQATLALLFFAAFAAIVIVGLVIMLRK